MSPAPTKDDRVSINSMGQKLDRSEVYGRGILDLKGVWLGEVSNTEVCSRGISKVYG